MTCLVECKIGEVEDTWGTPGAYDVRMRGHGSRAEVWLLLLFILPKITTFISKLKTVICMSVWSCITMCFFVFRREHWDKYSTFNCWSQLLEITRKQSHDHGILAEICGSHVVNRLIEIQENSQRIFKKVRMTTCKVSEIKPISNVVVGDAQDMYVIVALSQF